MKFNTKLSNIPSLLATVLILSTTLIGLSIPSTAHAQNQIKPKCSLATLKGLYATQFTGWMGSGINRVPYASQGSVVIDGNGYFEGSETVIIDGGQPYQRNITGTYTVDPNTCAGTAVLPVVGTFSFFILDNGKKVTNISITPGTSIAGTCEKI